MEQFLGLFRRTYEILPLPRLLLKSRLGIMKRHCLPETLIMLDTSLVFWLVLIDGIRHS